MTMTIHLIPAFSGTTPKRSRKESFSDAISGAAIAIMNALSDSQKEAAETPQLSSGTLAPAMSPSKAVDLRMKNFEQLRYLQQLYEDNILNETEYLEQRTIFWPYFETMIHKVHNTKSS